MKNILLEFGASPHEEEVEVAKILLRNDKSVRRILFLLENTAPGANTPDIQINNRLKWEIKTPQKFAKKTLEHSIRAATKQSENVIFYLKNLSKNIPEKNILRALQNLFYFTKNAKKLKIITKNSEIFDFKK